MQEFVKRHFRELNGALQRCRSDHYLELNSAKFYYIYRPSSHVKCPLHFPKKLLIIF